MSSLSSDRIDLWLLPGAEGFEESLLKRYRKLLTEEERCQEQRFYFPQDGRRYVLTRALIRTVLSRYSSVQPQEWRFSKNAHGKPEIAACHECARHLAFNLSHTRDLVICGVACGHRIGVDAENVLRRVRFQELECCFTPSERRAVRGLPKSTQTTRFHEHWTLKEAYVKADGRGLSIPLDYVGFDLVPTQGLYASFDPLLGDTPERWSFWLLYPTPQHVAAVCGSRSRGRPLELHMRRIVPLMGDEPFDCPKLGQLHRSARAAVHT